MDFLRIKGYTEGALTGRVSLAVDGRRAFGTAFEKKDNAGIQVLLPRYAGAVSVFLEFYDESSKKILKTAYLNWKSTEEQYDVYEINCISELLGVGLYFYKVVADTVYGRLFGHKAGREIRFYRNAYKSADIQFSLSEFLYPAPEERYGGVIYHVFVDRFRKGKTLACRSDAVIIPDWDNGIPEYPEYPGAHLQNNTFFGGTLFGVIEKLDYIASLGVNTIYLSPIFEAYSNHKYDTGNYMKVDEMFGGDEALELLIDEAGRRGIGIILDGVFNHTGADSIYFNRYGRYSEPGAYQTKDSRYYSWYHFDNFPNKYTSWWGIEILPRINPDNPECGEYFVGDGGVISKYAKMGVVGFRLDVADELSDTFISKIKKALEREKCGSVLYGEVWEDASNKIAYSTRKKYYLGSELDGVMNYPLRTGIIEFLLRRGTGELEYALTEVMENAPKRIRDLQMNLIGTHDTERIITVLGGESGDGYTNDVLAKKKMTPQEYEKGRARLKLAYTILATLPGIPAIFYGDEAGLEGYHDPFNRRPFPWGREDMELTLHYSRLGAIRRENPVYRKGEFSLVRLDSLCLIFERREGDYKYVTVVNNSDGELSLSFDGLATGLICGKRGRVALVPQMSSEIFKIKKDKKYRIC